LSVGLSGWISAAMLWLIAARRGFLLVRAGEWRRLALIALSAIAMGLVTRLMADFFSLTLIESRIAQVGLLMLVIASGIILYASCLRLTGIVRPHEWRALFRRR
jgi:putative peptidoglycan lipid II flippase